MARFAGSIDVGNKLNAPIAVSAGELLSVLERCCGLVGLVGLKFAP